jgi:hypothetical protein
MPDGVQQPLLYKATQIYENQHEEKGYQQAEKTEGNAKSHVIKLRSYYDNIGKGQKEKRKELQKLDANGI